MKLPGVPGAAAHTFAQVPKVAIPRSVFDRSYSHKTCVTAAFLQPFYVDEALPGDTFSMKVSAFLRMATPLKPVMDNQYVDVFFFAIPYRLVWSNWEKFNGSQDNPGDSTSYVIPQTVAPAGGWTTGSLFDLMGLPVGQVGLSVSALPLRAYNRVYNEWFRDQNLQTSRPVSMGDGPDATTDFVLKRRTKRHDYFTSCLPWPQKGTAVSLPLSGTAPVISTGDGQPTFSGSFGGAGSAKLQEPAAGVAVNWSVAGTLAQNVSWLNTKLVANLANASAATINELRQSFQIQRLLERDARGGSRYIEIIKSHFGVTSPDARLQRTEYLGGGSVPVMVSPIAQTSSTDATTPQANLAAIGTATMTNMGFYKSFTEHCIVLGLINVRTDLHYWQGIERMWSRSTRFDFYWPALAHIGEQAVLNKEIYAKNTADDLLVFGYQERFGEYRYKPSQVTSIFRPVVTAGATSIALWHLAQEFTALPTLSATFIEDTPPMSRVKAVTTEVDFIADIYCKLRCARPMPVYGVPGLIDHF